MHVLFLHTLVLAEPSSTISTLASSCSGSTLTNIDCKALGLTLLRNYLMADVAMEPVHR